MKTHHKTAIKSFLRLSCFPVLIFSALSWVFINYVPSQEYTKGCLVNCPENMRNDLVGGSKLMLLYLATIVVVFLILIPVIRKNRILSSIVLLLPSVVPVFFVIISLYNILSRGPGRIFFILGITSVLTIGIVLWNWREVFKQ